MNETWITFAAALLLIATRGRPRPGRLSSSPPASWARTACSLEDLARDGMRVFEGGEPRPNRVLRRQRSAASRTGCFLTAAILPGPFDEPRREGAARSGTYMAAGGTSRSRFWIRHSPRRPAIGICSYYRTLDGGYCSCRAD